MYTTPFRKCDHISRRTSLTALKPNYTSFLTVTRIMLLELELLKQLPHVLQLDILLTNAMDSFDIINCCMITKVFLTNFTNFIVQTLHNRQIYVESNWTIKFQQLYVQSFKGCKFYKSKFYCYCLRWLRTVHVWLLVRFSVLPLIYSCAGNTCGKLVNGHERGVVN